MKHIVAIIMLFIVLTAIPAQALNRPGAKFARFINKARVTRDLPTLDVNRTLTHYAVQHTKKMIESGDLFHSGSQYGGCSVWAENVGVGTRPWEIHQAFMQSAPHRQNILGPYHLMGIGARRDSSGRLWVTEIFCG